MENNTLNLFFYGVNYTAWKVSKYWVFFWSVFSRIRTEYGDLWSKYRSEKTPHLDTLHAVWQNRFTIFITSPRKSKFMLKNSPEKNCVILSIECFLLFIVTYFHWFRQWGLLIDVFYILVKVVIKKAFRD